MNPSSTGEIVLAAGARCDVGEEERFASLGGHTHFAPLCRIAITPSIEIWPSCS